MKKKGFTLIELLATIFIIAIIIVIGTLTITHFIDDSKKIVNKVSIQSIKDSAISYVIEFKSSDEYWYKKSINENEYTCTTIKQLINKGYLKNNLVDAETNQKIDLNSQIKISRDKNMVLSSEISNNIEECDITKPNISLEIIGEKYGESNWYYKDDTKIVINVASTSIIDEYNFILGSNTKTAKKNGTSCNTEKCELDLKELTTIGGKQLKVCASVKNINDIYSDVICIEDINADFYVPTIPIIKPNDGELLTSGKWHKDRFDLIISGGGMSPSGIYYEYKIGEEDYNKISSNKINITNSNITYSVHTCNNVGRCSNDIPYLSMIDKTKPSILSFTKNTSNYVKTVVLTAKIKDTESGIVKYKISRDSSYVDTGWSYVTETTSEITKTFNATSNATYYLWVEDKVGNYSSSSITINNIDRIGPTYVSGGEVSLGSVSDAVFTDVSTPVSVYYLIKTNNINPSANDFTSTSTTFSYSCDNTYYAYAKAIDYLGNYTIKYLGSAYGGSCCNQPLERLGLKDLVKDGTPIFTNAATTDEGIYKIEDDLDTSYYFRGASTRNYVKFAKYNSDVWVGPYNNNNNYKRYYNSENECKNANSGNFAKNNCKKILSKGTDMYWRIIRINGDGTIRMIYDGTQAWANGESSEDRSIYVSHLTIGGIPFNTIMFYDKEDAIKYIDPNAPIEVKNMFVISPKIDGWYNSNLKNTVYQQYISDGIFCNDNVTKLGGADLDSNGIYEVGYRYTDALTRIFRSSNPSLQCNDLQSRYTWNEDRLNGNKYLNNPVATITADEVMLAGGITSSPNRSYYLYTGNSYWTLSPTGYYGSINEVYIISVNENGELVEADNSVYKGVKPVINLKSNVLFTGTGTKDDPFVPTGFCE